MNTLNTITKRSIAATAIAAALGTAGVPQTASATVYTFTWVGKFTMLDSGGAPLANSSIPPKGNNQFQTNISGTLTYNDVTLTGSMTVEPFNFFSNNATLPADAQGVTLEYIGNGTCTANDPAQGCGAGNLMLGNMIFNWNGNNGIPVSVIFDATGLLNYLGGTPTVGGVISGAGATPASDGTYVGASVPGTGNGPGGSPGYLALGPNPFVTTAWNTTSLCTRAGAVNDGACMGLTPSGALPMINDTAPNANDFTANTGGTIGGQPMIDGPFAGSNATFDFTSMTLISDGSLSFTEPADISTTIAETGTPTTHMLNIGTVSDEPGGSTVEYRVNGGSWVADSGTTNNVTFNLSQSVNTFNIEWRVTDGGNVAISPQVVTITITDTTAPTYTLLPGDVTVSVGSTAESVTFAGVNAVTATDAIDPTPTIEWSLDELTWTEYDPSVATSSTSFGPNANTVYWRVTDDTGNSFTHQQTVTLNLPSGIVGQPCTVDSQLLDASIGSRNLEGSFTMRDSNGNLVGTVDRFVTGSINTAATCTDNSCTTSGATLASPTPFYGNLWNTTTIRLFNQPGTYTFETCPGDGSTQCTAPRPLSMTVGANQIGAHMLFFWNGNNNIDVVVVWDLDCGGAELVSTDPDGDGIIGTRMVDGPFQGMNAAFDMSTASGQRAITNGGYSVSVPVVKNSTPNTSPVAVSAGSIGSGVGGVTVTANDLRNAGAPTDSSVARSCVGGCFDFTVGGRSTGETIQIVLPLSEPIPWYSIYRKYNPASNSWVPFVSNGTDSVQTAALNSAGLCPEPGAGDYGPYSSGIMDGMLRPGDQCVQLTITDNGPNDMDSTNGVIADPGGVGVTSGPSTPEASTSGGGCTLSNQQAAGQRLDLWLLGSLLAWFGIRRKLQ